MYYYDRNYNNGYSRGRGTWRSPSRYRGAYSNWNTNNGRGGYRSNNDFNNSYPRYNYRNQETNNQVYGQQQNNSANTYRNYGIAYSEIESICSSLDSVQILSGSSDLLKICQGKKFIQRMNDLWPQIEKQTNFLRVIVATASATQADLLPLTHAFLGEVLSSKLIEIIADKICSLAYNNQIQMNHIYLNFIQYTVKILLLGFENLPTKMDIHLTKVHSIISTLNDLTNFLNDETVNRMKALKAKIKDQYNAKAAADENQLSARDRYQRNFLAGSQGAPPNDFRQLSLIPTTEDIDIKNVVYLRPAKIDGRYDSDEHYLDVQFRLLREDLIRPLREGIAAYQQKVSNNFELFVYKNVELEPAKLHQQTGELVIYAKIQIPRRMRMNKKLIFGSLVCLSTDDFKTKFLFATVLDRDLLQNGKVGLKFEGAAEVNSKRKYCMVESPAFFEAYRHVMTALQTLPPNEPIPFSRYFVNINVNTQVPKYFERNIINFDVLFKEPRNARMLRNRLNVYNLQQYTVAEDFGMDDSQFSALINTLQSDLAIIQGPPGTGKTYMGLQIAKLLFANINLWYSSVEQRPMLVVCYTNHALDQFLEGISKFQQDGIYSNKG